ncbi:MAG: hypothetical protein U0263_18030 [Polyangiaceae bacterium]
MRSHPRGALRGLTCLLLATRAGGEEVKTRPLGEAIQAEGVRCMTRQELVQNVELWLGRGTLDERISIRVEELDPTSLRFVVSRGGAPAAERRFKTTDVACPDLRAAVALAIALAIDATVLKAVLEPVAPAPTEPPPAPRETEPPAKPKAAKPKARAVPKPRSPDEAGLEAEVHAMVLVGVLPRATVAGQVGAAFRIAPDLALRISGFGTPPRDVPVGSSSAEVGMAAGVLGACLTRPLSFARVRGCAGGAAGRWSAEGRGFARDRVTALPWAAATADLELLVPVADALAFSARAEAVFPFVRPVLEERDPRGGVLAQEQAPPAGFGAGVGVVVGFP